MQCAISFSLYGLNPIYVNGAIANSALYKKIYPAWKCIMYVDKNQNKNTINRLEKNDVIVKIINRSLLSGMFWRLYALCDSFFTYCIIRDCDSRLNLREYYAVKEWLKSGKEVHIIKDHKNHTAPIMGGMWGMKYETIRNFADLLDEVIEKYENKKISNKIGKHLYGDQLFLKEEIYPLIKEKCLIHTSKNLKYKLPNNGFIGQIYSAKGIPRNV